MKRIDDECRGKGSVSDGDFFFQSSREGVALGEGGMGEQRRSGGTSGGVLRGEGELGQLQNQGRVLGLPSGRGGFGEGRGVLVGPQGRWRGAERMLVGRGVAGQ